MGCARPSTRTMRPSARPPRRCAPWPRRAAPLDARDHAVAVHRVAQLIRRNKEVAFDVAPRRFGHDETVTVAVRNQSAGQQIGIAHGGLRRWLGGRRGAGRSRRSPCACRSGDFSLPRAPSSVTESVRRACCTRPWRFNRDRIFGSARRPACRNVRPSAISRGLAGRVNPARKFRTSSSEGAGCGDISRRHCSVWVAVRPPAAPSSEDRTAEPGETGRELGVYIGRETKYNFVETVLPPGF